MTASLLSESDQHTAAADFARDGFWIAPPLIPAELLARVRTRIDAVYAGNYETGIPPLGPPPKRTQPPTALVKIDNAHRSDRTILELISHPAIGQWASALTSAKFVQVFATQLLIKPPLPEGQVSVGWHQDQEYWNPALEGELFTAWVAISEVTENSGPMRFVRGSQHWGLLNSGDFFSSNLDALKYSIREKSDRNSWQEVAAVMPPGAVSFHHNLTVHGSGPNLSTAARVSFAIHLRTDKSGLREGINWRDVNYLNDFADPQGCPVCYRAAGLQ
jgi:hypothetical protein|uniref:phytanoyl-CoA dioxygenase family protein n=1 Tax=Cephaloticoccus sp. TaxID=1985742 RepID=UPI00404AF60E